METPDQSELTPREELLALHRSMCDEAIDLMVRKNQDYAGEARPLGNLELCNLIGLCPTSRGILIRITDKVARAARVLESGKAEVNDETLKDTFLDLINYTVLLAYALQEEGSTL